MLGFADFILIRILISFFWRGGGYRKTTLFFLKLYSILALITERNLIFDSREVNSVTGEKFKFIIILGFLS